MHKQAHRFVLLAALLTSNGAWSQTEPAAAGALPTIEEAQAKYLGRWMLFAAQFGSWPEEFTEVRAGADGKSRNCTNSAPVQLSNQ
ncbi:MAG: hypothetical protein H0W48_06620 [Methylibium sp.]|nr:hypothetical protein [Methylibium sp.]